MQIFKRFRPAQKEKPQLGNTPRPALSGNLVVDEHFVAASGLDLDKYIEAGDLTAVHHIIRYFWARRIISELPSASLVLDLGCGSGYGTFALAQSRGDITFHGFDYDPRAIAQASATYRRDNLIFRVGDPSDWRTSIGDQIYQAVTCFDVLEHVAHRDLLLEALVRHLDEGGFLLFSTPCGSTDNILKPDWKHHKIEFSAASLYDLLGRYFGSIARSDETTFPGRDIFEQLHDRGIDYLLRMNPVICRHPMRIANPYRDS